MLPVKRQHDARTRQKHANKSHLCQNCPDGNCSPAGRRIGASVSILIYIYVGGGGGFQRRLNMSAFSEAFILTAARRR